MLGRSAILITGIVLGAAGDSNVRGRLVVQGTSAPTCATAAGGIDSGDLCVSDDIEANGDLDVAGTSALRGAVTVTGALSATTSLTSASLVSTTLEANLTAGACTAGTWKVDNATTRELCRCNDGGTAYDCWSATTANGPSD